MPHTFPNVGNAAEFVGQTPWSARVPLDPLFARRVRPFDDVKGRRGRRPRIRESAPQFMQVFGHAPVAVNFYTFFSCPFCPIVLARLQALQKEMGFSLKMFDVTLNPQTIMMKGIRSVPVVEVGDRRLVGNSTTEQLAGLIAFGQAPERLRAR